MNSFPHQLIYQPNGSPNGPVSPVHSPTHTPSPPTTSPGQTSPLSYPVSHGVPAIYSGGNMLFPFQSKLQPKLQSPLNHAFASHSLLNQNSGPPGQSLMQQTNMTVSQSHALSVTNTPHWQSQLSYYAICRNSNSPHHHARQAAAAARNSNLGNLGSSAIAITDPNNPNKPPLNGILPKKEKEANGEKQDQPFQQWMTIDLGGMGLKNISKELFHYNFLTTLYINHNNLTYVSSEISKLRNLTILDISGNKLSVLPPELGMLTNLRELLLFDNLLVNIPFELGTLYQLETLGLEGNVGLNDTIKSILQKDGTAAVIQFLRDNCQVPPRPIERDWIMLENEAGGDRGMSPVDRNWLYTKEKEMLYGYTPVWALEWDYRKELIMSEVLSYNADIVCLQEVDTSQYDEYFKDTFHNHGGYDSVYWPKSRAKTMADWEKKSVDGCATFYKSSKYQLIDKQLIEFNQVALQRPDFKKTDDMFNRVITKDNIAIVTLLENKETLSRVIVVNCHIHWDPTYADVKLVQVAMLMDELDKLAQKWCTSNSPYNYTSPQKISTIICGDFNSTPDSGVYEFLTRGIIRQDHDDFGDHRYGTYTSEGLSHKLSLKSAYSNIEELPFTNFTPSFTGVIDYVWYSTNTLSVTGLLGGIDKEYLTKMVGFPNAHFPSDHIVILAEFRVKPPQTIPQPPQFGLSNSGLQRRFNSSQLNSRRYGCNNG
ncbi:21725_t:CDS:2 [Rhizophagus irregularis]|nr:21725_t:CDS:2 [Rhizophagus irregularis]